MATIDLALLPAFLAVAELGSFSAAAKRLGVEKSSVSRSIARLEEALETRLVHRTTRRVSLSGAGSALYESISGPMASLQTAVDSAVDLGGAPTGRLRITAPIDLGAIILSESVARFTLRHPKVKIELRLTSDVVDLVAGSFDLGLRISTRPLRDSSLHARSVGELQLGLFASPLYIARRGAPRSPQHLDDHEWVVFPSTRRLELRSAEGVVEIATAGQVLCDDMFFLLHAVRQGVGIGVLPLLLAEHDLIAGQLVQIMPSWAATGGRIWLLTPAGRKAAKSVATFADVVQETLAAHRLAKVR